LPVVALLVAVVVMLGPASPAQARYAAFVMDAQTGQVLHAANADTRNYPASLTKMMTLYMTFEALEKGRLRLDQPLRVSRRAQGMTPSKLGLKAGQTITVKNAILALVTKSANDVAVVLAEAMAESEYKFALKMTERARQLGMTRTTFRNASGLPNRGQLSTARDMATLARALIYHFPKYYHYFSTDRFTYKGRTYGNHNNLLGRYKGTDGVKTGYIRASGFNLAASVKRNGRRLIAVVFGGRTARSRDRHMIRLLDQSFTRLKRLQTIPVVAPPPQKPARAIRVAAAQGDAAPAPDDKPAAVPPAKAASDRAADPAVAHAAVDAPMPPATARPKAIKAAARELALAEGDWAIQVGAYSRAGWAHDAATRALNRIPQLLRHSRLSVSRVRGRNSPIYRARLTELSKRRAEQACRLLESMNHDCLVIRPTGGVEIAFNSDTRG